MKNILFLLFVTMYVSCTALFASDTTRTKINIKKDNETIFVENLITSVKNNDFVYIAQHMNDTVEFLIKTDSVIQLNVVFKLKATQALNYVLKNYPIDFYAVFRYDDLSEDGCIIYEMKFEAQPKFKLSNVRFWFYMKEDKIIRILAY